MKSTALILSGGRGLRFGTDLPKQYMELAGRRILAYSVRAFEDSRVDEVVICAAPEYLDLCQRIAEEEGCSKFTRVIPGGSQRYFSVLNGLRAICSKEAEPPDLVLIHDGARPMIRPEAINEILACTMQYGAAIAAMPCTDTIKIVDPEGAIVSTTDRALTWAAQTPQAFRASEILDAYERIIAGREENELYGITDDAMVYQMAFPGRRVKVVPAGNENFKITAADDMIRAEGIIRKGGDLWKQDLTYHGN
ncbi:MAG: 2-C-methyl-D-erythritol 4-phosphate cytidylyltransferase [Parasporobacterium sp.]|nr:2-C-methyl-D-erythritol 4-phosphate cytidylyltransferase [Parasporobacterium sp.]